MLADELRDQVEYADDAVTAPLPTPFPIRLRGRVLGRLDRQALLAAVQSFAISRLILLVATYLAMAFHPSVWGRDHPASPTLWDAWYQWDARWYVRVARSGYHWHDLHTWSSVAFFPLYPILILVLVTVIPISTKLVAILISNALFFSALYVLHRLVRQDFGRAAAGRAVLYLSMFPTAMFFFAGYSESPFLLWSVLSVLSMRRRRWFWAGVWGCAAAATRSQGLALIVPFGIECWLAYGSSWRQLLRGLWIGLIPIGWVGLALFMRAQFDNPFLFIESQRAWHRTTSWPWVGVWETLQRIHPERIATVDPAHNLIELACVVLFGALIAAGWRRIPLSYSCYALASYGLVLINPAALDHYYLPLMSASRLCLSLFPCFITLALLGKHELVDRLVTAVGPALLAIFTVIFLQGAWVA